MKTKSLTLLFCLIGAWLAAQSIEAEYMAVVRKTLPEEVRQDFIKDGLRDQLRQNEEPDPVYYTLLVSDKETNFNYIQKIRNDQDVEDAHIIVAPAGFGTIYTNLLDSLYRDSYDVYGQLYFSEDPLKTMDWKITKERKEILGFEVRKATSEDEDFEYTAWYAPKINVPSGPALIWGLPGLILEAQRSSKKRSNIATYLAKTIKFPKRSPKIIKPDKGTQINAEQIGDIWNEANERRNQMYRDSAGVDKD